MYSKEFMKFLINYQTPEYDKSVEKHVQTFTFKTKGGRLAYEFLVNKR